MHDALFRAFFAEGRDLGDASTLLEVGESAGLGCGGLSRALDDGRYTEKVISDEELAGRLAVTSVPTVLVGRDDRPLEEAEPVVGTQTGNGRLEAAVERALKREIA